MLPSHAALAIALNTMPDDTPGRTSSKHLLMAAIWDDVLPAVTAGLHNTRAIMPRNKDALLQCCKTLHRLDFLLAAMLSAYPTSIDTHSPGGAWKAVFYFAAT